MKDSGAGVKFIYEFKTRSIAGDRLWDDCQLIGPLLSRIDPAGPHCAASRSPSWKNFSMEQKKKKGKEKISISFSQTSPRFGQCGVDEA